MKRYKIAGFPNESAAAYWRIKDPFKYLAKLGHETLTQNGITKDVVDEADIYVLQGCVDKAGIACLYEQQQEKGKKIVVDCDDWLEINDDNPHKKEHEITNAQEVIRTTMEIADLITTTQGHLAGKLKKINSNVQILPNLMDMSRWDLPKLKNDSNQIRIGYFGSMTHQNDIRMILPVLRRISKEFPEVIFVTVGDPRMGSEMEGINHECMLGVPFEYWPMKLHSLRLDIAIAPLSNNEFNFNKSAIKFYESAIAKYPFIGSDVIYGSVVKHLNNGMIAKNSEDWYECIKFMIQNKSVAEIMANNAYIYVKELKDLEKNMSVFDKAYCSLFE